MTDLRQTFLASNLELTSLEPQAPASPDSPAGEPSAQSDSKPAGMPAPVLLLPRRSSPRFHARSHKLFPCCRKLSASKPPQRLLTAFFLLVPFQSNNERPDYNVPERGSYSGEHHQERQMEVCLLSARAATLHGRDAALCASRTAFQSGIGGMYGGGDAILYGRDLDVPFGGDALVSFLQSFSHASANPDVWVERRGRTEEIAGQDPVSSILSPVCRCALVRVSAVKSYANPRVLDTVCTAMATRPVITVRMAYQGIRSATTT